MKINNSTKLNHLGEDSYTGLHPRFYFTRGGVVIQGAISIFFCPQYHHRSPHHNHISPEGRFFA